MDDREIIIVCAGAPNPSLHKISKIIQNHNRVKFVGVDRGALELINRGYKIDYAVGDFDSVPNKLHEIIELNSKAFVKVDSEKDDTDTQLAFQWIGENYPDAEVFVFGVLGENHGRLDHLLCNLFMIYNPLFYKIMLNTHFIEGHTEITWYGPGNHIVHPGRVLPDYVSIITMTNVKQLSISNAKYNLLSTDYSVPMALISNEFIDLNTPIAVSFSEGIIMIMKVNEGGEEL